MCIVSYLLVTTTYLHFMKKDNFLASTTISIDGLRAYMLSLIHTTFLNVNVELQQTPLFDKKKTYFLQIRAIL